MQGLVPFATLPDSAAGLTALAANLAITAGVQNGTAGQPQLRGAFAAQQAQALKDAVLTTANAYQLTGPRHVARRRLSVPDQLDL